jgi:hypothetical protein
MTDPRAANTPTVPMHCAPAALLLLTLSLLLLLVYGKAQA